MDIWDILEAISSNTVTFHKAAFRHGCKKEDILHALTTRVARWVEYDDPLKKVLIIGLDTDSRPLEIAVAASDKPLVIHAMPARKKYITKLEQGRHP